MTAADAGNGSAAPLLEARGITKRYATTTVLDDVDLDVEHGEVLIIVGPSGSGKSTLLRTLNLLEIPDEGSLHFEGRELIDPRCDLDEVRRKIGIVFQSYNLFPQHTAAGNVELALRLVGGASRQDAAARAREELDRVGLLGKADRPATRLSGGEQQRVAIARALALQPAMMLFDEVTAALDPELVQSVLEQLRRLADDGMTMVVVTHEIEFGLEIGTRMIVMDEGRIVEEGPPRDVVDRPSSERARRFFAHMQIRGEGAGLEPSVGAHDGA